MKRTTRWQGPTHRIGEKRSVGRYWCTTCDWSVGLDDAHADSYPAAAAVWVDPGHPFYRRRR